MAGVAVMPRAYRSTLDRAQDDRVNKAKADELHSYGVPVLWICLSPVEVQCLLDGGMPTLVERQLRGLLAPEPWES